MATWASLANNELFTYNELQDAVNTGALPGKGVTIPASDECVTKADIGTYVHNKTDDPSYVALASNEELTKVFAEIGTCRQMYIVTDSIDRSASDDGYVYYSYTDCCGVAYDTVGGAYPPVRSNVNHITPFATGAIYDTRFTYSPNPFILVGGVRTACSGTSSFSASGYYSGCVSN